MKKILAIALSVIMLFSSVTVLAEEVKPVTLRVDKVQATPGSRVELNINLENNTGLLAMVLVIGYDNDLIKLVEATDGGLIAGPVFGNDYSKMPFKLTWNSASRENFTEDGVLATLVFEVLEDTPVGDLEIKFGYRQENVFDVDFNDVPLAIENGMISVVNEITQDSADKLSFADVSENDWFYPAVSYAAKNKLMGGISDIAFAPNSPLTRGMLVTILHRNEGSPEATAAAFTDVADGMYYTNAVAWANQNGLVNGVSDSEFAPDLNITREQLSAILYRYAQYKKYNTELSEDVDLTVYEDAESISPFAVASMEYVVANGYIKGSSEKTLSPLGVASRAEVATILQRFLEANK